MAVPFVKVISETLLNIWENLKKSGQNLTFFLQFLQHQSFQKQTYFVNISRLSSGLKQSLPCLSIHISSWVLHFCSAVTLNLLLPMTSYGGNQLTSSSLHVSLSHYLFVCPLSPQACGPQYGYICGQLQYITGVCANVSSSFQVLNSIAPEVQSVYNSNMLLFCAKRDGICTDWSHKDKRSLSTKHSSTTQDSDIKLILPQRRGRLDHSS